VGNQLPRLISGIMIFVFSLAGFSACSRASIRQSQSEIPPAEQSESEQSSKVSQIFMWPIARPKISQNFKAEGNGRPHDGIDISAPRGTRIYAPADGTVIYAGHKFHGYGRMIVIEHSLKLATIFGHLQKLLVKSGEAVHKGSLIGLVGKTGRATAPHLHFEVRYNKVPVDPMMYMP
jgi:murein DD-endopeptidase MepM/ murein hydrolase activator NlpD